MTKKYLLTIADAEMCVYVNANMYCPVYLYWWFFYHLECTVL